MKDKCNVCKVMCEISRSDKPRACAFEHNGDENICPFDARYLDLSKHDKQIRNDAIEEYHLKLLNCQTDKVKSIHDAEIWVEFKRQSTRIAEQLKGAEND